MRPIAAVRQVWLTEADCDLDTFRTLVEQSTDPVDHPSAERVEHGVPLYDSDRLRALTATPQGLRDVQAELARTLMDGPGIVVFKGAFTDPAVVDRASAVFRELIEEERAAGTARGDHFAKPGANDRVWSALDKLAVRAPDVFADYYANDILALVAEAWLGPAYQVTSQVNVVNPGGAAQSPHRDYHLGFLTRRQAAGYPAHVHRLSPVLTLQGAVAHCDMPVESGPTLYLPHSQKYEPGYLAWRLPEFVEYFDIHHIQLPLDKGDAAFFNPALFPRRRAQSLVGRPAHGQLAPDLVRLRPRHGDGGPGGDGRGPLPGSGAPQVRGRHRGLAAPRRRRHRRGLPLPHRPGPRPARRRPRPGLPGRPPLAGPQRGLGSGPTAP